MKAFVIMYNRLTTAKKLCEDLAKAGCEVICIDNGSSYQPLLDSYKTEQFPVHFLKGGHKSLWESGIINQYSDSHYIVTDHDLDISGVPIDFVDKLMQGFDNPTVVKSGLSLRIDDLPENGYTREIKEYEKNYWKVRQANGFYLAEIDTTLAIYDHNRLLSFNNFFRAVRSAPPYSARHLPWYNEKEISDEEQYYINNIKDCGYWTMKYKQHFGK